MKLNGKELAIYAASRVGQADKEGKLWMRECEGLVRKRETYNQRWFIMCGNLLFYTKDETADSLTVGVIVLEQCQVESEAYSGNRNAFRLTFHDCDIGYWFFADSAREADEWIVGLQTASYEYLRLQFSELRGQLLHLTGEDPIGEGSPLEEWSVKGVSSLPASAPAYDGEPVFELSLGCSSLVRGTDGSPPSSIIVTHCMTPPQAYWIKYAQTEVIERAYDPQFFTTAVFYEGGVSTATQLKFEVFDVYDRQNNKMHILGRVDCNVMDLVKHPSKVQRLEIRFDDKVVGYLLVCLRKCGETNQEKRPMRHDYEKDLGGEEEKVDSPDSIRYSFKSPMDNLVVRTFQFPMWNDSMAKLDVTEVMGEGRFSFSIPIQLIEMFITEENTTVAHYHTLKGLTEHWQIVQSEALFELNMMVSHYQECVEALQRLSESGTLFKRSVMKDDPLLEFVPVNLHIQEMKVSEGNQQKEMVAYSAVTVGCPTAYSLKYRQGGLARIQATIPQLASAGSFAPATENKTYRVKQLLKRIQEHHQRVKQKVGVLEKEAAAGRIDKMKDTVRLLADRVANLENYCCVSLLNEALKVWYGNLEVSQIPVSVTSLTEMTAKAFLSRVEEHLVCVEAQVDGLTTISSEESLSQLKASIGDLLESLSDTVDNFQTALHFVLLKESYRLTLEKVPVGLKGYRHRRDIVYSHAVTSAVTSFVVKLIRSIGTKHFFKQLLDLGFLIHWESLLSTHSDEMGMLEDFIVAVHDLNTLKFKLVQADSMSDIPHIRGHRYRVTVEVPVQRALYRLLPSVLREGKEISTVAVLFTQGINEQQIIADKFGHSQLQDQINIKSLQRLTQYCERYKEKFGSAAIPLARKAKVATDLLQQLRSQIHARRAKNTDILTLSQELCRHLDCGRITSCKSAKDRTAMSVTLEEAKILLTLNMDQSCFQQALDTLRSRGTRLRNAEKNVNAPLYAFNALQVVTLPKNYRPPEGTYKKLQT